MNKLKPGKKDVVSVSLHLLENKLSKSLTLIVISASSHLLLRLGDTFDITIKQSLYGRKINII